MNTPTLPTLTIAELSAEMLLTTITATIELTMIGFIVAFPPLYLMRRRSTRLRHMRTLRERLLREEAGTTTTTTSESADAWLRSSQKK